MWKYKHVSAYLAAVRRAFDHCRAGGTVAMDWTGNALDLAGFRAEFVDALQRRINLKVGDDPSWRKLQPIYQTSLCRDQRRVRELLTTRIRHYQLETPEARQRFGHLLARCDD